LKDLSFFVCYNSIAVIHGLHGLQQQQLSVNRDGVGCTSCWITHRALSLAWCR